MLTLFIVKRAFILWSSNNVQKVSSVHGSIVLNVSIFWWNSQCNSEAVSLIINSIHISITSTIISLYHEMHLKRSESLYVFSLKSSSIATVSKLYLESIGWFFFLSCFFKLKTHFFEWVSFKEERYSFFSFAAIVIYLLTLANPRASKNIFCRAYIWTS